MTRSKKSSAVLGLYVVPKHEGEWFHIRASAVWVGLTPYELNRPSVEVGSVRRIGSAT